MLRRGRNKRRSGLVFSSEFACMPIAIKAALVVVLWMAATPLGAADLLMVLKESTVSGEFRTYFFQRDFDGGATDREDFAVGGKLFLETGTVHGISAGISFYTSQGSGLNDDSKDVYNLLAKDREGHHRDYSALGQAYIQSLFGKTTLKAGRQEMQTPWVNMHDIRLTPQSFEAVTLTNKSIPGLEVAGAHVTKIKQRTETSFMDMSNALGIPQDETVTLGGLVFKGIKGVKVQLWDSYAHEMWNDIYIRADFKTEATDTFYVFGDVRYLNRKDGGNELAGPLRTYHVGIRGGIEAGGAGLTIAHARNGDQGILRPWGHDLTVAPQVHVVDRAHEKATEVCMAYDFGEMGLRGFSGSVLYASFDTPERGRNASPDRNEIDCEFRYAFSGRLEGLSLRARYAVIDEDEAVGGEDFSDLRFYMQYKFHLLKK